MGKLTLHMGKNRMPSSSDESTNRKGGSVDGNPTRGSKPAPTPKSLGPRTA